MLTLVNHEYCSCPIYWLPCQTRQEKLVITEKGVHKRFTYFTCKDSIPKSPPAPLSRLLKGSLILPVFVRQNCMCSDFNFCDSASTAAVFAAIDTNTPCWACNMDAMAEPVSRTKRPTQDTNTVGCFAAEQPSKVAFVRFAKRSR